MKTTHTEYHYRYKRSRDGRIISGTTAEAKSTALYRVLGGMKVGQRRSNALRTAGVVWIERTR